MTKRIMVTLDEEQYEILKGIKGLGLKDAEKIRNILITYFSENGYVKEASNRSKTEKVKPYSYARFTWIKDIDVVKEANRLSKEFLVEPINTPEPSEQEVSIHKDSRKEIIIRADTVNAIISRFRAILYQKEIAPFTATDLKLRQEIIDLYPRNSPSPIPVGVSYEPKFITEIEDSYTRM